MSYSSHLAHSNDYAAQRILGHLLFQHSASNRAYFVVVSGRLSMAGRLVVQEKEGLADCHLPIALRAHPIVETSAGDCMLH